MTEVGILGYGSSWGSTLPPVHAVLLDTVNFLLREAVKLQSIGKLKCHVTSLLDKTCVNMTQAVAGFKAHSLCTT